MLVKKVDDIFILVRETHTHLMVDAGSRLLSLNVNNKINENISFGMCQQPLSQATMRQTHCV